MVERRRAALQFRADEAQLLEHVRRHARPLLAAPGPQGEHGAVLFELEAARDHQRDAARVAADGPLEGRVAQLDAPVVPVARRVDDAF